MFFKYIDAETVSKALDNIRFEFFEHFQAANSKIKDLQHKLDLYEFKNADRQLVVTEKVEALFKQGLPSSLAMQKVARETGLCLSTVQFIWKTSDRQFKAFQEYARAYLYQEFLKQGLTKNQIKLLIKLPRKKLLNMEQKECIAYL
ncbi:MAG: hypothetical protein IKR09_08715 [Alphaproteobacteria bacterium]|nr:hypothetical protein [Alphaproteobacteria bacterium]